jgi:TRADD-N domain-containing protein
VASSERSVSIWLMPAVGVVITAGIIGAAATIFAGSGQSKTSESRNEVPSVSIPAWFWVVLLALVLVAVAMLIWFVVQRYRVERAESAYRLEELKRDRDVLESAVERLRDKMALPSLVELNRIMLEQYHGIATDQATRSYRSSQRAMWLGFAAIVVAFFSALAVQQSDFRIAAAVLGLSGSGFAAFLSRTYLRVYEHSLEQLNRYFNQPLQNSYYLTAERLADGLNADAKNEAMREIVLNLLRETALVREAEVLSPKKARWRAGSPAADPHADISDQTPGP